ncbi:hypothetical protein HZB60_01970 [candidate division KSB1 bacterium]|nr:hypothetical protein [candidate division KSB1 bacterium]
MKKDRLVQLLSDVVRQLGYKVRTEDGNFRGGQCIFAEERLVFLNRRMSLDDRAELLARVLASENCDGLYLLPEVRRFVEQRKAAELLETDAADAPGPAE